ncbi:hypothetical protein B0H14DRAFT_2606351 [Mycena olivaceomarginata]|nr:hypothetical protein B0H14DRAFT_2606351 [Mycena olivaceomarginata]
MSMRGADSSGRGRACERRVGEDGRGEGRVWKQERGSCTGARRGAECAAARQRTWVGTGKGKSILGCRCRSARMQRAGSNMRREDARERKGVRLEGSVPDEGGSRKEGGKEGMRSGYEQLVVRRCLSPAPRVSLGGGQSACRGWQITLMRLCLGSTSRQSASTGSIQKNSLEFIVPRWIVALTVKKCIPQWSNGLYPWQLEFIIRILDGKDAICCTATGDSKSALFAVPIIVLRSGARKLSVPAPAYCSETVSEVRKAGVNLTGQIMECKWNVICVDPEHLREKAWRQIPAADKFRANLVYGCVDEAHLMREWGAVFCPLFKHISRFFRGSCPSTMAVIALSATIQPGAAFEGVCETLGFTEGDLYSSQKVSSIAEPHRLRHVKMYHSLWTAKDNQQILADLENNPYCQLVIATVAFSNGLNVKSLLDQHFHGCS